MALCDAELLLRFYRWSLLARQTGSRWLLAPPRTRPPAGGTEAIGVRDYAPGDDYRYLDWHWCARRDELLTRLFENRADVYPSILLDCSASMGLGRPSKFRLARQVAAALGYVALQSEACLRVAAFSEGIVAELPPLRGKAQIARLLHFLEGLRLQGKRTDLVRTAECLGRRSQRRGPVVVLSDFYEQAGFQRGLDLLLAAGYEPRVVQIYDSHEADPRLLGDVELVDVETETARRVTLTRRALERNRRLFAEFCEAVRRYCAQRGIPGIRLAGDTPPQEALWRILGGSATAFRRR